MSDNINFVRCAIMGSLRALHLFVLKLIKSDFVRKVVAACGSRFVVVLLSCCTFIIVTRTLGPEQRGQFGIANTLTALGVQLGIFGFHRANTFCLAHKCSLLPIMVSNSLLISVITGGVLIFVLFCFRHLLLGDAPFPLSLLVVSLLTIPIHICFILFQALLVGMQKFTHYNFSGILNRSIYMFLILGSTLIGIVSELTALLSQSIALFVCVIVIMRAFLQFVNRLKQPSLALIKSNLFYGWKAYLVSIFSWGIMRIDLFILRYFHGIEQVGHLSIALAFIDILLMFSVIITTILLPQLCTEPDLKKRWIIIKKISFGAIFVLFFIAFVVIIGKAPMLWICGERFAPCHLVVIYLLPGFVCLSITNIVEQFIYSICFPWSMVIIYGVAIIAKCIVSLTLIPQMGMQGIAISWVGINLFVCIAILAHSMIFYKYKISEFSSVQTT